MNFQEWIGSLISLLAFAALFFLNKRKLQPGPTSTRNADRREEEEDEEKEDDWTKFLKAAGRENAQKKTVPPPLPVIKPNPPLNKKILQKTKPVPVIHDEEHIKISKAGPVLRSAYISRLNRIPLVHGEWADQSPKIRQIIRDLPNLKTVIISREVLEKPRGWL